MPRITGIWDTLPKRNKGNIQRVFGRAYSSDPTASKVIALTHESKSLLRQRFNLVAEDEENHQSKAFKVVPVEDKSASASATKKQTVNHSAPPPPPTYDPPPKGNQNGGNVTKKKKKTTRTGGGHDYRAE